MHRGAWCAACRCGAATRFAYASLGARAAKTAAVVEGAVWQRAVHFSCVHGHPGLDWGGEGGREHSRTPTKRTPSERGHYTEGVMQGPRQGHGPAGLPDTRRTLPTLASGSCG